MEMSDRSRAAVEFLKDRGGEASMKDLCIALGYSWPAQLEIARGVMIRLERRGFVRKFVRPTRESRVAYYALSNSHG